MYQLTVFRQCPGCSAGRENSNRAQWSHWVGETEIRDPGGQSGLNLWDRKPERRVPQNRKGGEREREREKKEEGEGEKGRESQSTVLDTDRPHWSLWLSIDLHMHGGNYSKLPGRSKQNNS